MAGDTHVSMTEAIHFEKWCYSPTMHYLIRGMVSCARIIRSILYLAPVFLLITIAQAQEKQPSRSAQRKLVPKGVLLQKKDLGYLGAFRLPDGVHGASKFNYGGTAIAFNPHNDSLFIVGHDWDQAIAEVRIPALQTGAIGDLKTATVLQPFVKVAERIPVYTLEDTVKIGGMLVVDDHLIATLYEYYDGDADAVCSHFQLHSLDLAHAKVTGLNQVGTHGGGWVGGYMASVPDSWRTRLGAPYLTGQAALAIVSRTSAGPCIFGFNPATLGDKPAPAVPLLYYTLANPLAKEDTKNQLFNLTTEVRGVVFPDDTISVLFFGSHGVGQYGYGTGDECGDSIRKSKGPHAAPYTYQVWAYNANDLAMSKMQRKSPWHVRPYSVWTFDFPYHEDSKHIGGVAYDYKNNRIFVSQLLADTDRPIIHAFAIGGSK